MLSFIHIKFHLLHQLQSLAYILFSWTFCLCFPSIILYPGFFPNILPSAVRGVRTSHFCSWQTFNSSVRTTCLFLKCLATQEKYPPFISFFFLLQIRKRAWQFPPQNELSAAGRFSKPQREKKKPCELTWHACTSGWQSFRNLKTVLSSLFYFMMLCEINFISPFYFSILS